MSNKKTENTTTTTTAGTFEPPEFTFRSLFEPPVLNPVTRKSYTLPIFRFDNQYSINFHLAWIGQFVAFLSWFAFSPLIPSAVKNDLKLTSLQVANSNLVSLSSTLLARLMIGPIVDRWGPRKAMAGLLLFGAIPSGLAGTAHTAGGLYAIRFFIGFLGGVFVPCQAWPTAFFDKKIVGRSNALTAGWGNMGGGLTFIIMTLVYNALVNQQHLASHIAWRIAFVIIPVPAIFTIVAAILILGTDHPAGKWSDRNKFPAQGGPGTVQENTVDSSSENGSDDASSNKEKKGAQTSVAVKNVEEGAAQPTPVAASTYSTKEVLSTPVTWLPALGYVTTLGWEVTMNATLAGTLLNLFGGHTFTQTKAGYLASVYGLLNLWARPLGGYLGDLCYARWGVNGKKFLMLTCGFLEGGMALALGLYIEFGNKLGLPAVVVCLVIMAHLNFMANGACFSLVPHCSPQANGLVSGLVGGLGNLGGIIFALIFRFQTIPGKAFWVGGIFIMIMNLLISFIRIPKASR